MESIASLMAVTSLAEPTAVRSFLDVSNARMSSGSLLADLPRALMAVWLLLSAVFAAAAVAPFILPAETLESLFPACAARLRGQPCIFCGMTTAYIRIAEGDWTGAATANAGAMPLYAGSLVNFALAFAYCVCKGERCNFWH
jgi:hypothetical protein